MGKTASLIGFIFGVTGLVFALIGLIYMPFSIIALMLSVAGLVLSIIGRKKSIKNNLPAGLATAGFVTGIVGTCLSSVYAITCGLCVLCATGTGTLL